MPVETGFDAQEHDKGNRKVDQQKQHERIFFIVLAQVSAGDTYNKSKQDESGDDQRHLHTTLLLGIVETHGMFVNPLVVNCAF